jgi:hypothetical protein
MMARMCTFELWVAEHHARTDELVQRQERFMVAYIATISRWGFTNDSPASHGFKVYLIASFLGLYRERAMVIWWRNG